MLARPHIPLASFLLLTTVASGSGCGMDAGNTSRMAFRASRPTDGAWAFTITDHSGAGQMLLDDRYRNDICRRAGQDLRCEIRGLFPGGHSVEVQMPNAVLRRTALVGIPWPKHPLVVRVYDVEQARSAAYAGADAVLYEGEDRDVAQDITRVAHAAGARMVLALPGEAVAFTGADAVWDRALDPETKRRFPETRELIPNKQGDLVGTAAARGDRESLEALLRASGVVEVQKAEHTALGLLAPGGMLIGANNLELCKQRKKQPVLRNGTAQLKSLDARHAVVEFRLDDKSLLWAANFDPAADWRFVPEGVAQPLDLLGSSLDGDAIRIRPNDFSLIVRLPGRDPSRL